MRGIAALPHAFLLAAARRCGIAWRKGEEAGTTPGGASDGACDGREAAISHALPVEAIGRDSYRVALIISRSGEIIDAARRARRACMCAHPAAQTRIVSVAAI